MRIAFFVADYPNASETFVARQIAGMRALGHEAVVITGHHHDKQTDPLDAQIPIYAIRRKGSPIAALLRLLGHGLTSAGARRRLAAIIRAALDRRTASVADLATTPAKLGAFDAIVAHFGPAGVRALALRQAGVLSGPLAVVFHGMDMSDNRTLQRHLRHYRRLFREAELLLPISELWRRRLFEWGAPAERIIVLRMGVDVDRFAPPDDGRPLRRPLRALSVGRLVEKKGLRYAIEGAERTAAMVELDIIGYGPLEEELAQLANAGSNTTRLLGKCAHAEVFRRLANADVFLLPSVVAADGDMEGIPVALMEAMALGVVVIASRHSGIPELIEDGVDGLLVDEHSGAQIAAALDRLAAGKVDIAGLRRRARAKVARDFNNAILDRELEALLAGMSPGPVG